MTPYALLEWDSAFFGKRIARVAEGRYSLQQLLTCIERARTEAVDCLYLLVDSADLDTCHAAHQAGFLHVDVRLTLQGRARRITPSPAGIRLASAADRARLREIAARSHRDSRFYADHHFDRARCDELYATWVERSLDGTLADVVLVAQANTAVAGYLSCQKQADGTGSIGLFAVAEEQRGRGHGSRLLDAALDWFEEQGAHQLNVVTQGRNAAAQRIYQTRGFTTAKAEVWFHCWPAGPS